MRNSGVEVVMSWTMSQYYRPTVLKKHISKIMMFGSGT